MYLTVNIDSHRPVEEEQMVGAEYCPVLNDLLAMSDYVVVLANLTAASTHLIGREQLSAMKSSATLINISRGWCPHYNILLLTNNITQL